MVDDILEIDITLQDILKEIKGGIWIILYAVAMGILVAVLATIYKERVATYKATSTIIMSKEAALYFVEDQYTKNDIDLYVKSGNTYTEIASSNLVLDSTLDRLKTVGDWGNSLTRADLRSMLKAGYKEDTLVIELTGKSENRLIIKDIVNAYADSFIEVSNNLLPVAMLKVMDRAETPEGMIRSNLVKNVVIGIGVGVMGSLFLILIQLLIRKSKITTEQEIMNLLEMDVITTIR
nr:hypothetical protein [uncultured Cellulosilyticum sp.]